LSVARPGPIRFWLALALVTATVGCQQWVTGGQGTHREQRDQKRLLGAWRSSVHFDAGPFAALSDLEFLFVFNAGGTLTESSNYDAVPPVAPAYGGWDQTGPGEFVARYEFFVTRPPQKLDELTTGGGWMPDGRGIFDERFRVSADGASFDSSFRYTPLKADGSPAGEVVTGRGHGVRIRAAPG